MDFKELENLGYSSFEIEQLQDLGIAELVLSQMEAVDQEDKEVVVGAPRWATAALSLLSAALLAAPWAAEIVGSVNSFLDNSRKEAHRELLKEAFRGEKVDISWDVAVLDGINSYVAIDGRGCLIPWYEIKSSSKCLDGTEWEDLSNRQNP